MCKLLKHGGKEDGGRWGKGSAEQLLSQRRSPRGSGCAFWCMYLQGVGNALEKGRFLLSLRGKDIAIISLTKPHSATTPYSFFFQFILLVINNVIFINTFMNVFFFKNLVYI